MARPRNPKELIDEDLRRQRDKEFSGNGVDYFYPDSKQIERLREEYLYDAKNPDIALRAICRAALIAHDETRMRKLTQAERREIFKRQSELAGELQKYIDGFTFYQAVAQRDSWEKYINDPLMKNRSLFSDLLGRLSAQSKMAADDIDPSIFKRNHEHHALASRLKRYCEKGILPMKVSSSNESRLANLFRELCEMIGLEAPENISPYLS